MASVRMISLAVVGLILAANLHLSVAQIGVFYGGLGGNLPAPADVVGVVTTNNIQKLRLLEPNHEMLTALKGKNVEVYLGVANRNITPFSVSLPLAEQWVQINVKAYVPAVNIKYIIVGDDMSRNSDNNQFAFFLNITVANIQKALQNQGLKDIKVTTTVDTSIFNQVVANPLPSTSTLLPESEDILRSILKLLSSNGAPLMVNLYPYYEFVRHQDAISSEFAQFSAKGCVLKDGKLCYQNKFDAILDSFYTVLEKLGYPQMEIVVAETGWPSAGGVSATVNNEEKYITHLIHHVNKGTPKRPNKPVQVFLNLFDENQRGRPEIEKHFGLLTADKKMKFPVELFPSA